MNCSIASLLQIHYHFRIGGVREVINGYSEAFAGISEPDSFNALLCSYDGDQSYRGLKFINVSECEYHNFTNVDTFNSYREILINKLETVLEKMPLPAAIVCHNMTLAKNPALSSALRAIAKKKDCREYRFFWVIHDFAEEGRVDMLNSIEHLQELGVKIKDDLYALGAPVHFIVPGYSAHTILKNAGLVASCVPNPVRKINISCDSLDRIALLENLTDLATQDGCEFDPERPVLCYPSRLIKRKNMLESVALACICLDANLILGSPGTNSADMTLYNNLLNFVKESGLRVVFNTSRLPWKSIVGNNEYCGNPVPYLYTICDRALSTSLSEGFGYALYEPWLYQKAVFARRPAGFIYPDAMDSSLLYEHLPIPVEWVNWKGLKKTFQRDYFKINGLRTVYKEMESAMVVSGTVDFGVLEEDTQFRILTKLRFDKNAEGQFVELLQKSMPGWPGLKKAKITDAAIVHKNYNIVRNEFSDKHFRETFKDCISKIPEVIPTSIEYEKINSELLKCGFKLFFSISTGYNENVIK